MNNHRTGKMRFIESQTLPACLEGRRRVSAAAEMAVREEEPQGSLSLMLSQCKFRSPDTHDGNVGSSSCIVDDRNILSMSKKNSWTSNTNCNLLKTEKQWKSTLKNHSSIVDHRPNISNISHGWTSSQTFFNWLVNCAKCAEIPRSFPFFCSSSSPPWIA